jgi:NAD(P)H-quinone oxidoreductase subunit 6
MEHFSNLQPLVGENVETLLFYVVAIFAIPMAFGVIFDRVIIRAGFLLIGLFGAVSGLFMLLQAGFLALAQIMIYAVGITLVVVIALMLTNPKQETEKHVAVHAQRLPGILMTILMFVTIYLAIRAEQWPISSEPLQAQNVKVLGAFLMTNYSLPFEFASILLLAALMGSVLLAKSNAATEKITAPDRPNISTRETDDVVKV